MTSVLGQGHNDLDNDLVVRRRHVTGEGRNGDNVTSGAALAGKLLLLLLYLSLLDVNF